jgi:hypothetical protein
VLFQAGDTVWADIRILEVSERPLVVYPPFGLRIEAGQQRVLVAETELEDCWFTDAKNMLWAGSTVLRGSGTGIVVHTFGKMLVDMYSDAASMHPVWPQMGDLGRLTSGRKQVFVHHLSRKFGLLVRDCKQTTKSVLGLSDATKAALPCHVVLHWRSPLFRVCDEAQQLRVDHVRLGKLVREEADDAMGEVLAACAVCSAGWLSLEKMKTWSSGAINLASVTAEGPPDPVGTALLRWSLSHLGAKVWRGELIVVVLFC